MNYRVSLTVRAEQDRESAFDWYAANYSEDYALRWLDGLRRTISTLIRNPKRCAKAAEYRRFDFGLYELHYGTRRNKHRILFRVEDDQVIVVHLRHSARRNLQKGDL